MSRTSSRRRSPSSPASSRRCRIWSSSSRQRTRYLQLMAEQARNMQRLVDDLLTLSALESDQNALVESAFDVVPLLLEVSADAKALSAGRQTVALDVGEPAIGHGQSRRARERVRQSRRATRFAIRRMAAAITLALADRRPRPGRVQRRGHRHRHRAGARAEAHRALLPRRSSRSRATRRHGSRARDRQARAAAPPGGARRDERARPGQHVHGDTAGSANRRAAPDARADEASPSPPVQSATSS